MLEELDPRDPLDDYYELEGGVLGSLLFMGRVGLFVAALRAFPRWLSAQADAMEPLSGLRDDLMEAWRRLRLYPQAPQGPAARPETERIRRFAEMVERERRLQGAVRSAASWQQEAIRLLQQRARRTRERDVPLTPERVFRILERRMTPVRVWLRDRRLVSSPIVPPEAVNVPRTHRNFLRMLRRLPELVQPHVKEAYRRYIREVLTNLESVPLYITRYDLIPYMTGLPRPDLLSVREADQRLLQWLEEVVPRVEPPSMDLLPRSMRVRRQLERLAEQQPRPQIRLRQARRILADLAASLGGDYEELARQIRRARSWRDLELQMGKLLEEASTSFSVLERLMVRMPRLATTLSRLDRSVFQEIFGAATGPEILERLRQLRGRERVEHHARILRRIETWIRERTEEDLSLRFRHREMRRITQVTGRRHLEALDDMTSAWRAMSPAERERYQAILGWMFPAEGRSLRRELERIPPLSPDLDIVVSGVASRVNVLYHLMQPNRSADPSRFVAVDYLYTSRLHPLRPRALRDAPYRLEASINSLLVRLQRTVAELEQALRRRFPNTIDQIMLTVERVGDGVHRRLVLRIVPTAPDMRPVDFVVPIPSIYGTYRQALRDARPFTVPLLRTPPHLRDAIGSEYMTALDRFVYMLEERLPKMLRDIEENVDLPDTISRLIGQMRRLRTSIFRERTVHEGMPLIDVVKASTIRTPAMEAMRRLERSPRAEREFTEQLMHLDRFDRLWKMGGVYMAYDTEFWNPLMGSKGTGLQPAMQHGRSRVYQFGGTIFRKAADSARPEAVASVEFVAPMFRWSEVSRRLGMRVSSGQQLRIALQNMTDRPRDRLLGMLYDIVHFIERTQGTAAVDVQLERMATGYLSIRQGNQEYVYQGGRWVGNAPDFAPQRFPGESDVGYYLRVVRELADRHGVAYGLGHNAADVDRDLVRRLFERHGLDVPVFLEPERTIDTLLVRRSMEVGVHSRAGLGELAARALGFASEEELVDMLRRDPTQVLSRADRYVAGTLPRMLLSGVATHAADVDALLTGGVLSTWLAREMERPEVRSQLAMSRAVLTQRYGRAARTRYFSTLVPGAAHLEEGPELLAYVTQEEATYGSTASGFLRGMVPLERLANPIRQRYQDLKMRMLFPIHRMERGSHFVAGGLVQQTMHMAEILARPEVTHRTARVAYVPEGLLETPDSAGLVTPLLAEALEGPPTVRATRITVRLTEQEKQELVEEASRRVRAVIQASGQKDLQRLLTGDMWQSDPLFRRLWILYQEQAALEMLASRAENETLRDAIRRRLEDIALEAESLLMDPARAEALRNARLEHRFREARRELVRGQLGITKPPARQDLFRGLEGMLSGSAPQAPRGRFYPMVLALERISELSTLPSVMHLSLQYVPEESTTVFKIAAGWRAFKGSVKVSASLELPGFMAEAVLPAGPMKFKRGEIGQLVQVQIGRVLRAAADDIERGEPVEKVLQRTARALAKLADMPAQQIANLLEYDNLARVVRLTYSPELEQAITRNVSLGRIMAMLSEAGITVSRVFDQTERSIRELRASLGLPKSKAELLWEASSVWDRQMSQLEQEIRQVLATGVDPVSGRRLTREEARQMARLAGALDAARRFHRDSQIAALFDVVPLPRAGDVKMVTGFLALESVSLMARYEAKPDRGRAMSRRGGRPTLKTRMSPLDRELWVDQMRRTFGPGVAAILAGELDQTLAFDLYNAKRESHRLERWIAMLVADGEIPAPLAYRPDKLVEQIRLEGDQYVLEVAYEGRVLRYTLPVSATMKDVFLMYRQGALRLGAGVQVGGARVARFRLGSEFEQTVMRGLFTEHRARAFETIELQHGASLQQLIRPLRPSLLIGDAAFGVQRPMQHPLFSGAVAGVELDLLGQRISWDKAAELLRRAGLSERDVRLVLGDPDLLREVIRKIDPSSRRDLEAILRRLERGPRWVSASVYLPSLAGEFARLQSGALATELSSYYVQFIEGYEKRYAEMAAEAIQQVLQLARAGNVSRIRELLEGEHGKALEWLRSLDRSFVERAVGAAIRLQSRGMMRFMEGQYRVAQSAQHLQLEMAQLARMREEAGSPEAFLERLRTYLTRKATREYRIAAEELGSVVETAAEDLARYVERQMQQYGAAVWKWEGFGVAEGFISRKQARRAVAKARSYLELLRSHRLSYKETLKEDLKAFGLSADLLDIGRLQKEVQQMERAAKQGGFLHAFSFRQPTFANMMPVMVHRTYVLSEEALRLLGADPEAANLVSDVLTTAMARKDFDGDLDFLGIVSSPALSGALREQELSRMPRQLLAFLERWAPEVRNMVTVEESGRILIRPDIEPSVFSDTRVLTQLLGREGAALESRSSDFVAREQLSLLKDVVGQFGAFSKRSRLRSIYQQEFLGVVEAMHRRPEVFSDQELSVVERMLERYERLSQHERVRPLGDALEVLAAAETWITQEGAIEKAKKGDATTRAVEALDVLAGLYGRRGRRGFEQALGRVVSPEALTKSSLLSHYWRALGVQPFATPEEARVFLSSDEGRKMRELMSELLTLGYQMQVVPSEIRSRLGMGSDYLLNYANMADPVRLFAEEVHGRLSTLEALGRDLLADLLPWEAPQMPKGALARAYEAVTRHVRPGAVLPLMLASRLLNVSVADLAHKEEERPVVQRRWRRAPLRQVTASQEQAMRRLLASGSTMTRLRYGFEVPEPDTMIIR